MNAHASSDLDHQVTTVRVALASLPDVLTRFDVFVGKMKHKMTTQPGEASEEVLAWLKELTLERRYSLDEINRFLRSLKRAMFESVMYESLGSFDLYYAVEVLPLIMNEKYTEAATDAWKEFIHNFENAWRSSEKRGLILELPKMSSAR